MAKKKKSKASQKTSSTKQYILSPTETDAGILWLNSLTEDLFRDEILEHLFRKMGKAGILSWYENIHGRNDKGVDYLLAFNSEFGQRIIGIQAKSKEITRTGAGGTYSSLDVKRECEAAMRHEFAVQKSKSRLDNIELWCSSHITEDGEREFNAAGDTIKIQVKKASQIFSLVEKYCPDLLNKIPSCALANFVRDKRNPIPKKIKLLGCELHPRKNFLEPLFSRYSYGSASHIQARNKVIQKKAATASLPEIIFSKNHSLVLAPELSGKTYLLEHVECLIAEAQCIPIMLRKETLAAGKLHSVYTLIAKQLGFYTPYEIEELVKTVRVFLLVDDLDSLSEETKAILFSQSAEQIKVLATAKRVSSEFANLEVFHITGVNLGCITKFLRGLDASLANNKAFTDRAHSFIGRTLTTSGLPSNPFTISMMLAECQNSPQKFSTPTMGRLIERFVEMQLGSHSDNTIRVDFETKREFLTRLGGRKNAKFTFDEFKKEIVKFIQGHSHPHSLEDFLFDLNHSGVFTFEDGTVAWSHPALKEYYWVKNLVQKDNLAPILRRLQKDFNLTLAALTGSQLQNGGKVINVLVKELDKIKLPTPNALLSIVQERGVLQLFRTDEDEEKWLAQLEADGLGSGNSSDKHPIASLAEFNLSRDVKEKTSSEATAEEKSEPELNPEIKEAMKDELKRQIEPLITQWAESKLHIAFNLSALLVNARGTKTTTKQECVKHILRATQFLGHWFRDLIEATFADKKTAKLNIEGARIFSQMLITDRMIGDPFLINIFKKMLIQAKTDEETIMILDLLLGCGEDDYDLIVKKLKDIDRPELIVAFYFRVAVLYFFRFHRDRDRHALRNLLKDIRKSCKAVDLLPIAT